MKRYKEQLMNNLNELEVRALEDIAQTLLLDDGTQLQYNEIWFFNNYASIETIDDLRTFLHIFMTEGYDDNNEDDYFNLELIITKIKEFYKQNY